MLKNNLPTAKDKQQPMMILKFPNRHSASILSTTIPTNHMSPNQILWMQTHITESTLISFEFFSLLSVSEKFHLSPQVEFHPFWCYPTKKNPTERVAKRETMKLSLNVIGEHRQIFPSSRDKLFHKRQETQLFKSGVWMSNCLET
jgi:hypothetical protein